MTLREAKERLAAAGIEDALREARMLFSDIGGVPDTDLLNLSVSSDRPALLDAVARREQREPLQYILGSVGFYRETYTVTKDCLIPRSDTETLVGYAVSHLPQGGFFLDLCTGSGCIAVSTLANTKNTRALAVDLSEGALALAEKNAAQNGVADRAAFLLSDVLRAPVTDKKVCAVLSNPPYVTDAEYKVLAPELRYEPRMALVGGKDGGDFYRVLVPMYQDLLLPDGFFGFEIGAGQGDLLRRIAGENRMTCEILPDLAGLDRVAVLKFPQ